MADAVDIAYFTLCILLCIGAVLVLGWFLRLELKHRSSSATFKSLFNPFFTFMHLYAVTSFLTSFTDGLSYITEEPHNKHLNGVSITTDTLRIGLYLALIYIRCNAVVEGKRRLSLFITSVWRISLLSTAATFVSGALNASYDETDESINSAFETSGIFLGLSAITLDITYTVVFVRYLRNFSRNMSTSKTAQSTRMYLLSKYGCITCSLAILATLSGAVHIMEPEKIVDRAAAAVLQTSMFLILFFFAKLRYDMYQADVAGMTTKGVVSTAKTTQSDAQRTLTVASTRSQFDHQNTSV